MKTNYELRYASNPRDAKSYDTTRLREDFLIQNLFVNNEVNMVYSMYDRLIVGGAKPVGEVLTKESKGSLANPTIAMSSGTFTPFFFKTCITPIAE